MLFPRKTDFAFMLHHKNDLFSITKVERKQGEVVEGSSFVQCRGLQFGIFTFVVPGGDEATSSRCEC